MKYKSILIFLLTAAVFGCKDEIDDGIWTEPREQIVELSTSFGVMHIYLYQSTPLHRENFLELVKTGFYDSTEFHRIVPNFVIQGGDPNSKDQDRSNDGVGGPGYTIPAEIDSSKHKHKYGALGAARKGDATNPERESSGSQFYIVSYPNGTPFLDGNYTVFGELIKGLEVSKTIERQPRNFRDLPNDRIPMSIKVLELTQTEMDEKGLILPK